MRKRVLAIFISCFSTLIAFDATIPVLHLPDFYNEETKADFLNNLEKAASEIGFFGLTGTGVETDLLDRSYEQIIAYFNRSADEKMGLKTSDGQRGYVPGESAKGENGSTLKSSFMLEES